jgi:hypothetical protein
VGGVGGDDDADDRQWLPAVWAAVLAAVDGDVVRERGRDGEDVGDGVRDDVSAAFVLVALAPRCFAARDVAVPLA